MKKNMKLSIPTPCHENWDKMSQQQQGRFCKVCTKTVIDFTTMSDAKIIEIVQQAKEGEVCGKFHTSQLNRTLIPLQTPKWYNATVWKYVLTGTIMFTALQSNAQQHVNNKHFTTQSKADTTQPQIEMGEVRIMPSTAKHNELYEFYIKVVDEKGVMLSGVTINSEYISGAISFNKKLGYKISTTQKNATLEIIKFGYETTFLSTSPKSKKVVLHKNIPKEHVKMGIVQSVD